jgi:hypothetical protein
MTADRESNVGARRSLRCALTLRTSHDPAPESTDRSPPNRTFRWARLNRLPALYLSFPLYLRLRVLCVLRGEIIRLGVGRSNQLIQPAVGEHDIDI